MAHTYRSSLRRWATGIVELVMADVVNGDAFTRNMPAPHDPASMLFLVVMDGYSPLLSRAHQDDLHGHKYLSRDDQILKEVLMREGSVFVAAAQHMLREGVCTDVVEKYLHEYQRWPMAALVGREHLADAIAQRHMGEGTGVDTFDCSSRERRALTLNIRYHRPDRWTGRRRRAQWPPLDDLLSLTPKLAHGQKLERQKRTGHDSI